MTTGRLAGPGLRLRQREALTGVALLLPFIAVFAVFFVVPVTRAIGLSLGAPEGSQRGGGLTLDNYVFLAGDPLFHKTLLVTATFAVLSVLGVLVLSTVYAVLSDGSGRGHALLRVLLFLPALTPLAVAPILWRFLYHPSGIVNGALGLADIGPISWLTNGAAALVGMTIANVWYLGSLFLIVLLSGLRSIPRDVYDAALVDGATRWTRFRHITLPLLRPSIAIVVIVSATLTIKSPVLPLLLTSGGPDGATRILSLFVYETGFRFFHFEVASAASVVMMAILVICSVLVLRLLRPRT